MLLEGATEGQEECADHNQTIRYVEQLHSSIFKLLFERARTCQYELGLPRLLPPRKNRRGHLRPRLRRHQSQDLAEGRHQASQDGLPRRGDPLHRLALDLSPDETQPSEHHKVSFNQDQKNLFMSFEFMQMDLRKFLQNNKRVIDHSLAKSFIKQLLSALDYCHSSGVLHRDIKPHNILIKDKTIKLADFGLARATGLEQKSMSRQIETLWYRAPEVLLGNRRYGQGVDIWAAGCIYVQLLGGRPLFQGDSQFGQIIKIFQIFGTPNSNLHRSIFDCPDFKIQFPKFREQGLREALGWMQEKDFEICSKMLALAPQQRVSARRLLESPYFANQ